MKEDQTINVHIFIHNNGENAQLTFISKQLNQLLKGATIMAGELDDLTAKVEANATVDQSAITLLTELKARLDAAGTDPTKLRALSEALGSSSQQLADAIVANTPADPSASA